MSASARKLPLTTSIFKQIERPLSEKAAIPLLFYSSVTSTLMTIFMEMVFAPGGT